MAAACATLQPLRCCVSTVGSTACKLLHARTRVTYSKFSFLKSRSLLSRALSASHHDSANRVKFDRQPESWLFVSDSVAGLYGAHVNLDLDLDNRLSGDKLKQLESNVDRRGLPIDLSKLAVDHATLMSLEKKRKELVVERNDISEKLRLKKEEFKGREEECQDVVQELTTKLLNIKELIKDMNIWELEESVMLRCLRLPNDLHPTTSSNESTLMKELHVLKDSIQKTSHAEIAKKYNLIKFSNVGPKAYYLKGALAKTELALTSSVINYFQDHKFKFISGPEFFKTPIVEGCGLDVHNPTEVLTMLDASDANIEPMNHLLGISPATFVAYVAKCCIGDKALPLNMFACGRNYQNNHLPGLYGANQSTQVGIFLCVLKEDLDRHFDKAIELIWNFLAPLGFPIRLCQIKARDLGLAESRRVELQIYAPSLQQYIPIAKVSDLSDFVSRRLMVRHNLSHTDYRFAPILHMVSGSALNITSLLAAWVEYSNTELDKFSLLPFPALPST